MPDRARGRPTSDVGLADFVLAATLVDDGSREQQCRWLGEMLCLPVSVDRGPDTSRPTGTSQQQQKPPPVPPPAPPAPRVAERPASREAPGVTGPAWKVAAPATSDANPRIPSRLEAPDPGPRKPEAGWLENAPDLPAAKAFSFEDLPSLESLFEPGCERALLSSSVSTVQPDGDIDFASILAKVTRRLPIVELPREPWPTSRLGVQLLVDHGRGLWPYSRDQMELRSAIERVVGADRVQTQCFDISPLRGVGTGPRVDWEHPYAPPAPGTPVVVLSDLGLARRQDWFAGAPPSEWIDFARQVRRADCPLLAIVPYASERVPRELRARFKVLPWSRTTTVSIIRNLIGRGLGGRG